MCGASDCSTCYGPGYDRDDDDDSFDEDDDSLDEDECHDPDNALELPIEATP